MIFVIMGMEVHPFDRLARAVDELHRTNAVGEGFMVQLGSCTYEPRFAPYVRYLSFGEVCDNIRRASVVITHAGAGSTLVSIQQGKHPVVVPRRSRLGEHVDDHQVPFAEKLAQAGLVTLVDDADALPQVIASARGRRALERADARATALTSWLERFWSALPRSAPR